jgi:1,4-dihydroxy-2-naphthoate octaprenyltransferase
VDGERGLPGVRGHGSRVAATRTGGSVTLEPFVRLALFVLAALAVLGLVLVAGWQGWWVAIIVGVVGLAAAAALTLEPEPAPQKTTMETLVDLDERLAAVERRRIGS